jgi:cytochrome c553
MRNAIAGIALTAAVSGAAVLVAAGADPPAWAYPVPPPPAPQATVDESPKSVPGSTRTFTRAQIRDLHNPPDWHPEDHPTMPEVVAHGRRPAVRACGYCHMPTGLGHPINASLAGLPAPYIVQQMVDYKNGLR